MSDRTKRVLVLRHALPLNQAVNAAAVLGTSVVDPGGAAIGAVGTDASGHVFAGITTVPIPVLVAAPTELARLHAAAADDPSVTAIALAEVARQARTYESYLTALATTRDADADLVALLIHGPVTAVNRLTRKLSLLPADNPPVPVEARP